MFLLPLATIIFLGYTFDLRSYKFNSGTVYDYNEIKSLTKITEINELSAEYRLIESEVELRKFLGLDITTNLKALVNEYRYAYRDELKYLINAWTVNEVHLAMKLSLRSMNETVPFDAPQVSGWEAQGRELNGTHYVKSIIYGSDIFQLLSIRSKNSDDKATIREAILSTMGRSGTLDESFRGKLQAILEEHDTGYYSSSFGTFPYFSDNIPPHNVHDILELKKNLTEIMKMLNDGKGAVLFYEMQPMSLLSSTFPLVEINNEIIEKLDDVEKKYEDLRFAHDGFDRWIDNLPNDVMEEDMEKIVHVYEEVNQAHSDMELAIKTMDVSTLGSIDQFSRAMSSYGNTTDTQKYRRKLELLRQQYLDE